METWLIVCDPQNPYADERAFEIACQVGEDARIYGLVFNGDWWDFRTLSKWATKPSAAVIDDFGEELERGQAKIKTLLKRTKPKKKKWNDGNHEWRLMRTMMTSPQTAKLLAAKAIADATSIPGLAELDKFGIEYSGEYPKGCWLKDPTVIPPEQNVYVEHGYTVRQKAGFTASALVESRATNVVTGHVERMAMVWKKLVGNRRFFGIEGGTLSRIGEPGLGEGIYQGIPFNNPDMINHNQGVVLLTYDQKQWWPELVPIVKGRTVWRGRKYQA